jgi:sphingomyelin phosphodiesterase acid-like 3
METSMTRAGCAFRSAVAALIILISPFLVAAADAADGTFVLVSDFHFDPFDPPGLAKTLAGIDPADWPAHFSAAADQAFSTYGKDTNHALLASSLAALSAHRADADFVIVPGDLLSHDFEKNAANALGAPTTSDAVRRFAADTAIFVADQVGAAFAGKPVIIALGNNDSACGDYEIEPGGSYLAVTRDAIRRLAGADLVASDFDTTYAAGGYYAMRHPTLDNTLVLVVNDVLWSAKYQDACGKDGIKAGEAELTWVADRLAEQKAVGGKVWLVHHIPWGIDPYSTVQAKADTCAAKTVPFLKESFSARFLDLVRQYADTVDTSLSGHVHHDTYRLLLGADGQPIQADKVPPAISPIYDQNPAFQLWRYDATSGEPTDYTTIYLANLTEASTSAPGVWQEEYTFTEAYDQPRYSAEAIAAIWKEMAVTGATQEKFRKFYNVSHGALDENTLSAYSCAIGHLDPESFQTCYCGG